MSGEILRGGWSRQLGRRLGPAMVTHLRATAADRHAEAAMTLGIGIRRLPA